MGVSISEVTLRLPGIKLVSGVGPFSFTAVRVVRLKVTRSEISNKSYWKFIYNVRSCSLTRTTPVISVLITVKVDDLYTVLKFNAFFRLLSSKSNGLNVSVFIFFSFMATIRPKMRTQCYLSSLVAARKIYYLSVVANPNSYCQAQESFLTESSTPNIFAIMV